MAAPFEKDVIYTTLSPDDFRQVINNRRHYIDIGLEEPAISGTSIKPDKQFRTRTPLGTWAPLDAVRSGEYVAENLSKLDGLDPELVVEEIADAPRRALQQAAERGTEVHDALSQHILDGTPLNDPFILGPEAQEFYSAGLAFMADYSPEWIATEVIVVVPDLGLAGTIDAIARFGGKVVLLDWKTRGGRHGAYAEEAGQLGVYAWGEYMIVGAHPGEKVPMPDVDELAVVSLCADGSYGLYPIDLEQARSAARHMWHAHAAVRLLDEIGQHAIGQPVISAPTQQTLDDEKLTQRIDWLRGRIGALTSEARAEAVRTWPSDAPTKAAAICSGREVDAIVACLDAVEAAHGLPFGPVDPTLPPLEPGSLSPSRRRN